MAPRRRVVTKLGTLLRAARHALSVDQKGFASLVWVSERTLSRWENGVRPTPKQAERVLGACESVPADLYNALGEALGFEMQDDEEPPAVAPIAPPPPPPPPVVEAAPIALPPVVAPPAPPEPPRPTTAELRATLDAIVYAAAEERDVLPRHLRAFGVELLQAADRLGLEAKEAAHLLAAPERTKAKSVVEESP